MKMKKWKDMSTEEAIAHTKRIRNALEVSQDTFAEACGITKACYYQWESGAGAFRKRVIERGFKKYSINPDDLPKSLVIRTGDHETHALHQASTNHARKAAINAEIARLQRELKDN